MNSLTSAAKEGMDTLVEFGSLELHKRLLCCLFILQLHVHGASHHLKQYTRVYPLEQLVDRCLLYLRQPSFN